jgi:hypothetical protein
MKRSQILDGGIDPLLGKRLEAAVPPIPHLVLEMKYRYNINNDYL